MSLMNREAPGFAEARGQSSSSVVARIGEDSYQALRALKPGNSQGSNMFLGRYRRIVTADEDGELTSQHQEQWDGSVQVCPGDQVAGNTVGTGGSHNGRLFAHLTGTSSVSSVPIRWYLSSNSYCSSADYHIGTRVLSMGVGGAYSVNLPVWDIPWNIPAGTYYPCAIINEGNPVTEVNYTDNVAMSDWATVRVYSATGFECTGQF